MAETPVQLEMDIRSVEELSRYALDTLLTGQVDEENPTDFGREATLVLHALRTGIDAIEVSPAPLENEEVQVLLEIEAELTQLLQLSKADLALEQWAQRFRREPEVQRPLLTDGNSAELNKALKNHITSLSTSQAFTPLQDAGDESVYSQVWHQVVGKRIGVLQQVVDEINYLEIV
jgi:hypothetical protein